MTSQNLTSTPHPQPLPEDLYARLESYSWSTDSEFQSGLRAILGTPATSPQSPTPNRSIASFPPPAQAAPVSQTDELTLRARVFYYARAFNLPTIDFDGYKAWRARQPAHALSSLQLTPAAMTAAGGAERGNGQYLGDGQSIADLVGGSSTESTPRKGPPSRAQANGGDVGPEEHRAEVGQTQEQDQDRHRESPPPASFADIMELIQSGKPIPGIKDIPDTVLEGQGTQPSKSRRQKPWEQISNPTFSG